MVPRVSIKGGQKNPEISMLLIMRSPVEVESGVNWINTKGLVSVSFFYIVPTYLYFPVWSLSLSVCVHLAVALHISPKSKKCT